MIEEEDMSAVSQFAFDLGKLMGTTSNTESSVCRYLRNRGVYTAEIEAFYKAALVLAGAFYREPT
jgi:hypothetical protein